MFEEALADLRIFTRESKQKKIKLKFLFELECGVVFGVRTKLHTAFVCLSVDHTHTLKSAYKRESIILPPTSDITLLCAMHQEYKFLFN